MVFDLNDDVMGVEKIIDAVLMIVLVTMILTAAGFVVYILYQLLRRYSLGKIEYRRYFEEKGVFEGMEVYLVEEFTNHGVLPMFFVDVETHINSKLKMTGCANSNEINQEFISRFFVMPYTRVKRKHKVICKKRGYYKLESAKLKFMRMEVYKESMAELMVYPRELEISDINRLNQCLQINSISRRPMIRDPFSFARVRQYSYGDGMNIINHKATAKLGRLMVNESEFVLGRKIMIYLNFQTGTDGIPLEQFYEMLEKGCSYVAYLADKAYREGWQISFRANAKMINDARYVRVENGTGYAKYMEILEALACQRMTFGNSIGYLMNMDIDDMITNTEIIFFTGYIDESIETRIEFLEKMGNVVTVTDLREVAAVE